MSNDELLFFTSMPQMLPLYTALRDQLDQLHPDVTVVADSAALSKLKEAGVCICG